MNKQQRIEKVELLKRLMAGTATLKDFAPKIKLTIFETRPGFYEGITLQYLKGGGLAGVSSSVMELVESMEARAREKYPDLIFEWDVMPFVEYERLTKKLEEEY